MTRSVAVVLGAFVLASAATHASALVTMAVSMGARRTVAARPTAGVEARTTSSRERSVTAVPTGVSGNPASPHWNDQSALFAAGGSKPAGFATETVSTLTIAPA